MSAGVSLLFEIDSAEPLTGRIRGKDGETPFAGWLGLMSAVERAIAGTQCAELPEPGADAPPAAR